VALSYFGNLKTLHWLVFTLVATSAAWGHSGGVKPQYRLKVSLTDSHHEPISTDQSISTEHNMSCIALIENTGYIPITGYKHPYKRANVQTYKWTGQLK
jgi:hypothetical protein